MRASALRPPAFDRFEAAYVAVLDEVVNRPDGRVDSRGNPGRECRNVSFTLSQPCDRIVYNPARRLNPVFCWAEFLWYLAGRSDLGMIGYYAPGLARFSADGVSLTGTAYGARLFAPAFSGRSQWEQVAGLLRTDPDSKRAVLCPFDPAELRDLSNPDVTCTLALQFLIRDDALHLTVSMRGNDAVIGLACDVHAFTLIQEFTALELGVSIGSYTHHVTSMHVNDYDAEWAGRILDASLNPQAASPPESCLPVALMPAGTSWSTLATVQAWEEELRTNQRPLGERDVAGLGVEAYWQQVVLLFELYRQIRRAGDCPVSPWLLNALDPGYRWLATHRWSQCTHLAAGQAAASSLRRSS